MEETGGQKGGAHGAGGSSRTTRSSGRGCEKGVNQRGGGVWDKSGQGDEVKAEDQRKQERRGENERK